MSKKVLDTIIFDLDGVLANFHKAALALWDLPEEACHGNDSLPDVIGCSNTVFWAKIQESFWSGLELTHDAGHLIRIAQKYVDTNQIFFATSPSRSAGACSGKMLWVQKYFPEFERRTMIGAPKFLMGRSRSLLIDDWEKNLRPFREAGGQGFLLPRPWNVPKGRLIDPSAPWQLDTYLQGFDFDRVPYYV